MCASVIQVLEL